MNPTLYHPGQPQMQAQVILASTAAYSPPIYTIRGRLPRCIWPEVLTHRKFGRNARSSRAVPVERMLEEVRTDPFMPWHWGKNQRGMQAGEDHNEPVLFGPHKTNDACSRGEAWMVASWQAAKNAQAFMNAGYHKQIVNRLLEPFMWIDVLITATDWDNFLWLRDHSDAEPHLQDWARLAGQAIETAEVQELEPGQWHTPYVEAADFHSLEGEFNDGRTPIETLAQRVSSARCARISYTPFNTDKADIAADLDLYDKLMGADRLHASPTEHQATPDRMDPDYPNCNQWEASHLHGNLDGWIQFRKTIAGECYRKAS